SFLVSLVAAIGPGCRGACRRRLGLRALGGVRALAGARALGGVRVGPGLRLRRRLPLCAPGGATLLLGRLLLLPCLTAGLPLGHGALTVAVLPQLALATADVDGLADGVEAREVGLFDLTRTQVDPEDDDHGDGGVDEDADRPQVCDAGGDRADDGGSGNRQQPPRGDASGRRPLDVGAFAPQARTENR